MEEDLYFVDMRNAPTDHRTGGSASGIGRRPMTAVPVQGTRVYPAQQPQQVYYAPPPSPASSLFGGVSTGQIIDLVAQIFAALMPLSGGTDVDVGYAHGCFELDDLSRCTRAVRQA